MTEFAVGCIPAYEIVMPSVQPDLFFEDRLTREILPGTMIAEICARLDAKVSDLERAETF